MIIYTEVAIPPVAMSINIIYPAANPSFLMAALTVKSENRKKRLSTSKKARITRLPGWHEVDMYNCTLVHLSLPGE